MSTLAEPGSSRALENDEFEEVFEDGAIGMELEDVSKDESAGVTLRDLLWFRVSLCPPKTRQKSCLPLFIGAVLNIPIP